MVHIEDTSVANAAMMHTVWLPDIAHFAISPPLGLIAHVESPIRRHKSRICHDALVEGCKQAKEERVVDQQAQHFIKAPQVRPADQEDIGDVNTQNDQQDDEHKAHAMDALRGEGPCSLHWS